MSRSITNPTPEKLAAAKSTLEKCDFFSPPDPTVLDELNKLAAERPLHFHFGLNAGSFEDWGWLAKLTNASFVSMLNNNRSQPTRDVGVLRNLRKLIALNVNTAFEPKDAVLDFEPLTANATTLQELSLESPMPLTGRKTNLANVLTRLTGLRSLSVKNLDAACLKTDQLRSLVIYGKMKHPEAIQDSLRQLWIYYGQFPELPANVWDSIEELELMGNIKNLPEVWPSCSRLKRMDVDSTNIITLDWASKFEALETLVVRDWKGDVEAFQGVVQLPAMRQLWATFKPLKTNADKKNRLAEIIEQTGGKVALLTDHPGRITSRKWIDCD